MNANIDPGHAQRMDIIDAYIRHLRRAGYADTTIGPRRELLHRLERELPFGLAQTSTEELSGWLHRDGWQPNTKATYLRTMRSFYRWATNPRDPWLSFDPTVDMERLKLPRGGPRPVTDEQLRHILAHAVEPVRLWALIAAYQGLRAIEISRLDRQHITADSFVVVRGKGDRPRALVTHPDVWAAVRDLPPGPVATFPNGERATAYYVSLTAAQHFRRQLGLPGVGLHRLRHWLGVTVQRRYKNLRVTQAVLGHVSLSSTQIYTDASSDEQRAALATLPRLAG